MNITDGVPLMLRDAERARYRRRCWLARLWGRIFG